MTANIALDVVIGLVFIYLLYSLLATVISEIVATGLGLRARNLKEAVNRMLNDEEDVKDGIIGWLSRRWASIRFMKKRKEALSKKKNVVRNFYNHQEIKYLGSSGLFSYPSSFKAMSFSRTVLNVILNNEKGTKEILNDKLKSDILFGKDGDVKLDPETAEYIRTLWYESNEDVEKFKLQLEGWFDRTMEQAIEWYKRKIQIILLILGFFMAWFFNADTFVIIKKLSVDKDAREKMVSMANAYVQNNETKFDKSKAADTLDLKGIAQRLDSLLKVKRELDEDIANANSLLGLGGWLPDKVIVRTDSKTGKKNYTPLLDPKSLSDEDIKIASGTLNFTFSEKLVYFLWLGWRHFFGFLITAIAISLGAPFWFDMLNKVMKLRTSVKQEVSTPSTSAADQKNADKKDQP